MAASSLGGPWSPAQVPSPLLFRRLTAPRLQRRGKPVSSSPSPRFSILSLCRPRPLPFLPPAPPSSAPGRLQPPAGASSRHCELGLPRPRPRGQRGLGPAPSPGGPCPAPPHRPAQSGQAFPHPPAPKLARVQGKKFHPALGRRSGAEEGTGGEAGLGERDAGRREGTKERPGGSGGRLPPSLLLC